MNVCQLGNRPYGNDDVVKVMLKYQELFCREQNRQIEVDVHSVISGK